MYEVCTFIYTLMSLHEKVKMDTEYRIIKHQHPAVSWGGLGVKVDSDLTSKQRWRSPFTAGNN